MNTSRSSLFLIELILSIFFFILTAAVVIQLFVKSHLISQDAINSNHALLYTQNIAELFLATNGDFSAIESTFEPKILTDDSTINAVLYFDNDWQSVSDLADATCLVIMDYTPAGYHDAYAYLDIYVNPCSDQSKEILSNYRDAPDCIHQQKIKKYTGGLANGSKE